MNRSLLNELQRRQIYPSVTVVMNTTAGSVMSLGEIATAKRLVAHADERLVGDVGGDVRMKLRAELEALIAEHADTPAATAIAMCASPEYVAAVRLGCVVEDRVVIDDTFATRDLVADLNRSAQFRVVTVSEQMTRIFVGDRSRLVEERNELWPMVRGAEQSLVAWTRHVAQRLRDEDGNHRLATVIAGVDRTVRRGVVPAIFETIGLIGGNHDRSSWAELHEAAWPLVMDWLRSDQDAAMEALGRARSTRTFAGGIEEIWPLAQHGRVDTLVVENGFATPARIRDGQLERATDREAPDVVDDAVDEAIEAVLAARGRIVIVPDGGLEDHEHIAAVLRY